MLDPKKVLSQSVMIYIAREKEYISSTINNIKSNEFFASFKSFHYFCTAISWIAGNELHGVNPSFGSIYEERRYYVFF